MYFVFIYFLFAFVDAQLQTYNVVTNDFFKRNYGRVYFFFPKEWIQPHCFKMQ